MAKPPQHIFFYSILYIFFQTILLSDITVLISILQCKEIKRCVLRHYMVEVKLQRGKPNRNGQVENESQRTSGKRIATDKWKNEWQRKSGKANGNGKVKKRIATKFLLEVLRADR
ncbi:hypothetical protein EVAR_103383_1 [Eumeta japonica]|uniref:Uncharacterized protein n=1 Tax=Eumeta variegata TaxID=151549 RepID=A0A4C1YAD3_EUMVA|nr:hypothetical protein EVAR_103383_1 [Eumeta japonica]